MILGFLLDTKDVRAAVYSLSSFLMVCKYLGIPICPFFRPAPQLLTLPNRNANRKHLIANMLGMTPGVLEEAACAVDFPIAPMCPRVANVDNAVEEALNRFSTGIFLTMVTRADRNSLSPGRTCASVNLSLSFIGSRNPCLASSCGFPEVSRLEKIHHAVHTLTDVYIEQCAESNQALSKALQERAVKLGERVRIERAFCRLEIFRQAFGSSEPWESFEGSWAQDTFSTFVDRDRLKILVANFIQEFKQSFDTVELIQLHCIYGFLKRLVTPAINDFLWHSHHLSELKLIEHWASDDRVSLHVMSLPVYRTYTISGPLSRTGTRLHYHA